MSDPAEILARGWPVFPVRGGTWEDDGRLQAEDWKRPATRHGFKDARHDASMFTDDRFEVAVPTGAPIGAWVLDVDPARGGDTSIDALEFTNGPIETLECRTGSGGRHFYFKHVVGVTNSPGALKDGYPGLDVRGDGGYVIVPPSMHHEAGHRYTWRDPDAPIADAPQWLLDLVLKRAKPPQATAAAPAPPKTPTEVKNPKAYGASALDRAAKTVLDAAKGTRNDTLNRAAYSLRECIERGFVPKDKVIDGLQLAGERAGMSALEVRKTLQSALGNVHEPAPASEAAAEDSGGAPSNAIWAGNTSPLRLAEKFLEAGYTDPNGRVILRRWAGIWWGYYGQAYAPVEDEQLDSQLWKTLDRVYTPTSKGPVKLDPKVATVTNVRAALIGAGTLIGARLEPPVWIGSSPSPLDASTMVPVVNGLLNLTTGELLPVTPDLFVTAGLPVRWDPAAPEPKAWLDFLGSLWPDDPEPAQLLAEWFGYCLTADTSQQKLLLLYGPKRSGKGTIIRLLTDLLGDGQEHGNVAGPTLAGLTTNFGLQPLVGKLLAVVGDARMPPRADQQAVILERLLSITGEDRLDIDRKFKDAHSVRLSARIVLVSNELPRFNDASGAMASRCLILGTRRSYFGFEDTTLWPRLRAELPGILRWAVEGWRSLRARGFFQEPAVSKQAVAALHELASPVHAFVEDECVLGATESTTCVYLYERWADWCKTRGLQPSSLGVFARDLHAAFPGVSTVRPWKDGGATRVREFSGIDARPRA